MGVLDQLGLSGRPRREVEQQRIVCPSGAFLVEPHAAAVRLLVGQPAVDRLAYGDTGVVPCHAGELGGVAGSNHDVAGPPTLDPVAQIVRLQQRGRRDHDSA